MPRRQTGAAAGSKFLHRGLVAIAGALSSFTKALAVEEAANNVRVNTVLPGNVWTPMWRAACPDDEQGLLQAYQDGCRYVSPAMAARQAAQRMPRPHGRAGRKCWAALARWMRLAACASLSPPRPPSAPAKSSCL